MSGLEYGGDSLTPERQLNERDPGKTLRLIAELNQHCTREVDSGFEYYKLDDPEKFLDWAVENGFLLHGTTRQVDVFEPRQGHDTRRESGRKVAIYMGADAPIAMFMALIGGTNINGHSSFSSQSERNDDVSRAANYTFTVDNVNKVQEQGYVYIFSSEQIDADVGGEYHSYKPQRPIVAIKIERKDFHYPIQVMSQEEAEKLIDE